MGILLIKKKKLDKLKAKLDEQYEEMVTNDKENSR